MARKNKRHPPSSPNAPSAAAAAAASNKRRRIAPTTAAEPRDDRPSSAAAPAPAETPANTSSAPPAVASISAHASAQHTAAAYSTAPAIHIVPGSKIQAKVRAVLAALGQPPDTRLEEVGSRTEANSTSGSGDGGSAAKDVVLLEARAPGASKLISVVEIAKRALGDGDALGGQRAWWAYSGVKGVLEEVDGNAQSGKKGKGGIANNESGGKEDADAGGQEAGEDEEEAFEPLGEHGGLEAKKVRNVPVLMVYLATRPIPTLKALYGEQCSQD